MRSWAYAEDPRGEIPNDPVYETSTMTFAPDGSYAFDMGMVTLEGTWEKTGAEDDALLVHTEYGPGAETDVTITFRRGEDGEIEGLVLREGDGTSGLRYYVLRS